MPLSGSTSFKDEVYGEISIDNSELEDQVLIKADGFPTYNFANVVDDHDMAITHVVRGCEYLSSTPKYNLLYDAFGYEKPCYIHLPHILGSDGQKLSKRHGSTSFGDLVKEGYLPEAIINAIALLGWSPSDNQEFFTLEELENKFDIRGISKSPAVFDFEKLAWFNAHYIQKLDEEEFFSLISEKLHEFTRNCKDYKLLAKLLQTRIKKLYDFEDLVYFIDNYSPDNLEIYIHKKMKTTLENSLESLKLLSPLLTNCDTWNIETLQKLQTNCAEENGLKNGLIMWPLRVSLTGQASTICGSSEALILLGKEESLRRLNLSIEALNRHLN